MTQRVPGEIYACNGLPYRRGKLRKLIVLWRVSMPASASSGRNYAVFYTNILKRCSQDRVGNLDEGGQNVSTPSYKINKYWEVMDT